MSIQSELEAAGVPLQHDGSTLYARMCSASIPIVVEYGLRALIRVVVIDGEVWFFIPFAYEGN